MYRLQIKSVQKFFQRYESSFELRTTCFHEKRISKYLHEFFNQSKYSNKTAIYK
jgi:hypothetical protein